MHRSRLGRLALCLAGLAVAGVSVLGEPERSLASAPTHRADPAKVVGAQSCKECHHRNAYQAWRRSPHRTELYRKDQEKVRKFAEALSVRFPQRSGQCLTCHATVKEEQDTVKEIIDRYTKPLKELIDVIRGDFSPAKKSLEECEAVVKQKIRDHVVHEGNERERLLTEAGQPENLGAEASDIISKADTHVVSKVAGLSVRPDWKVEITDLDVAIKSILAAGHTNFLMIDTKAVKAWVKKHDRDPDLEGITVDRSPVIAVTAAKVKR